jgi:cation-transporting ATPase 13A3/4/5
MIHNCLLDVKVFQFRLYDYYIDGQMKIIVGIQNNFHKMTNKQIKQEFSEGLLNTEIEQLIKQYGENKTEVPKKGIIKILMEEIISPFYIFQFCSCALWFMDDYTLYASVILGTSLIGIIVTLYENMSQQKKLEEMSKFKSQVIVYRKYKKGNELEQKRIELDSD